MKYTKRLPAMLLAVVMALNFCPVMAQADDVIDGDMGVEDSIFGVKAQGSCGETLKWTVYEDGILLISGSGAMYDYESGTAPWHAYLADITDLVLKTGVTHIGASAFEDCSNLSGTLTLPEGLQSIGANAFYGCGGLEELTFAGVRVPEIAEDAFADLFALTTVYVPAVTYAEYVTALTPVLPEGVGIVAVGGEDPECAITASEARLSGDILEDYTDLGARLMMAVYDESDRFLGMTELVNGGEMIVEAGGIGLVRLFVLNSSYQPLEEAFFFEK